MILHTKIQDTFIKKVRQSGIDEALEWLGNCKNTQNESWPAPVKLQWDTESGDAVLEISEYMDFHNAQICKTQGGSCEVNNLKIGQKYYWRVNKGEVFCFETADTFPRFIRIDGITNVRDLGGLRIKQGLVYRGSALNEDPGSDDGHAITSEGRYTFCEELGIKTDLDLRLEYLEKLKESPAGAGVQFIQIPYRPYKEVFEPQYKDAVCKIMNVFANEANYPIYFHCAGGADRTGMVAMYLRAIAGEADADIHLDYELTSLAGAKRCRTAGYYTEMLTMLEAYAPGETFSEQLIRFLDSCGVTEDCRQKIKTILVGA